MGTPETPIVVSDSDLDEVSEEGWGKGKEGESYEEVSPAGRQELIAERDRNNVRLEEIAEQQDVLLSEQEALLKRNHQIGARLYKGRAPFASPRHAEPTDWRRPFEWDKLVDGLRTNCFKLPSFRKNQREIINAVLSKKDVFVVMPAGGGKSLCYQLPAVLSEGIALVVSPLVSLIHDQVNALQALRIGAECLTANTPQDEQCRILSELEARSCGANGAGGNPLRLLYVTPEKLARSSNFLSKLERCYEGGRLSLIAVDEAHCCSSWGHSFRADYLKLRMLKNRFPDVPLLALTATATDRVYYDVKEILQLRKCETFRASIDRPNLSYEVRTKTSEKQTNAEGIAEFIKTQGGGAGIVYCLTRKECEKMAGDLRREGIGADHYHADLDASERELVHSGWSWGQLQVIVATVAFGMGINKPNVRFVVHQTLSKSTETYYQESGRAGRDGRPAKCLLFFRPHDIFRLSPMVLCDRNGHDNLYRMALYAMSLRKCRRAALHMHFGEHERTCIDIQRDEAAACFVTDEARPATELCDICSAPGNVVRTDMTAYGRELRKLMEVDDPEAEDKRVTFLQLVKEVMARVRSVNVRPQPRAAELKVLQENIGRLVIQLLLRGYLKETWKTPAYQSISYLHLAHGREWRDEDLFLDTVEDSTLPTGAERRSAARGKPGGESSTPAAKLAPKLDRLRRQLAAEFGLSMTQIFSAPELKELASKQPTTLSEVEAILGKEKTVLCGRPVLDLIREAQEVAGHAEPAQRAARDEGRGAAGPKTPSKSAVARAAMTTPAAASSRGQGQAENGGGGGGSKRTSSRRETQAAKKRKA